MREKTDFIETRQSLLSRIKNSENNESWREFFDTYWKLIYGTAIQAGLSDAEAQDVVQETIIRVARTIPSFKYDPKIGSFKAWLRKLTRWRIADQMRKRARFPLAAEDCFGESDTEFENVPDDGDSSFEAWWDDEWRKTILAAAVERTKLKVDPSQFQIFELYVLRDLPVAQVASTLRINPAKIYLAKLRVGRTLKKELLALESEKKI